MSTADPTASFLRAIQRSGLLEYSQYTELNRWAQESSADVQGVAKEVFRRRWLTQYQIKEIFKGRGPSLVLGPYVILDLLGEGGMGKVFKAHHIRMARDVALKIIRKEKLSNPAAEGRFRAEIQAVAQMSHPNVVVAYDADQVGETHFYAMEYIDGTDLAQIVKARGPLPVEESCEYIRQSAMALQSAFEIGLVHRDIKPSNLLVTRTTKQVKVVDFGLARLGEQPTGPEANRITHEGYVLGTPDFVAPEQARNPAGADTRADIYALAGTLYYLLTGSPPFDGKTPADKLMKHCSDPPPDARVKRPDTPPHLAALLQWCMNKRPEDRPQTPAEMAMALQPYCPMFAHGVAPVHVPHTPYPQAPVAPQPAYAYPHPVQPYGPQAYPAAVDPAPSSQIFKLPPSTESDPIRRRAEPKRNYATPILFFIGGLLILAILGYAAFRTIKKDPPPALQREFTNALGMKLILLEGGKFTMGSAESEPGRNSDDWPTHEVTLKERFYISATEVTQAQYADIVGTNPSVSGKVGRGVDMPVENVTYAEAVDFCKKLTKTHSPRAGWEYRLPTEAEWEYACRAGSRTPFAVGEKLAYPVQAQFTKGPDDVDLLGVNDDDPDLKAPILPDRVAKRKERANAWGLSDMHGNVAEWCSDYYERPGDGVAAAEDPHGPTNGNRRVVRGGSWKDPAIACRSASRRGENPAVRHSEVGFRVVYAPVQR